MQDSAYNVPILAQHAGKAHRDDSEGVLTLLCVHSVLCLSQLKSFAI